MIGSEPVELLVPVYLNQRIVFDLVAMLQGGIATVTRVSESERSGSDSTGEVQASFGLTEALASLLRVNLSGAKRTSRTEEAGTMRDEDRVHTPSSLFFVLRQLLLEKGLLAAEPEGLPEPGDLIEFRASLKRNPIIETMDVFQEFISMAEVFDAGQGQSGGKNRASQRNEYKQLRQQIAAFATSMKAGNTIDLTTDALTTEFGAVITAEAQYLNDPTMSDLVDGTFRVTGKVIRSVKPDDGAISLIRKTALGRMSPEHLKEIFKGFAAVQAQGNFQLPALKWEVSGPVVQVLPIAIFA